MNIEIAKVSRSLEAVQGCAQPPPKPTSARRDSFGSFLAVMLVDGWWTEPVVTEKLISQAWTEMRLYGRVRLIGQLKSRLPWPAPMDELTLGLVTASSVRLLGCRRSLIGAIKIRAVSWPPARVQRLADLVLAQISRARADVIMELTRAKNPPGPRGRPARPEERARRKAVLEDVTQVYRAVFEPELDAAVQIAASMVYAGPLEPEQLAVVQAAVRKAGEVPERRARATISAVRMLTGTPLSARSLQPSRLPK